MKLRNALLTLSLVIAPTMASADYLDVITNRLNDGCSIEKYAKVVDEFRGVMKSEGYSYTVELVVPFIGDQLDAIFFVGRTKDLTTFGAENDRWTKALTNSKSPEAKINEKMNECATNVSRTGSTTM
jgi:hypothetical protein